MVTEILYQKIARDLKRKILAGDYPVGQLIPTENELETHYQVSKVTVRKAVEVLVTAGYLEKKSGIGTRVISNHLFNKLSKANSYTTLLKNQGDLQREVLDVTVQPADATPLAKSIRDNVVVLKWRYLLDGRPLILVTHYLPDPGSERDWNTVDRQNLYQLLQVNGRIISQFRDEFKAVLIDPTTQQNLAKADQLAMQRTRRSYDQNQRLVACSIAIYDTERLPYQIDYEV